MELTERLDLAKKTFTDFKNCETHFWSEWQRQKNLGIIPKVLELGVYSLKRVGPEFKDLPGQSTKLFILLSYHLGVDKYISVDIDDCQDTVDHCYKYLSLEKLDNHKYFQIDTMNFNVEEHFPNGIDIMFLDSSHDDSFPERIGYQGGGGAGKTYQEISKFARHLNENGVMFIHDTNNKYVPEKYGWNTSGAIERFLDENDGFIFEELNSNKHGLGRISRG